MLKRALFFFILTLTAPALSWGQATAYRRIVSFEWEAIEGAASYELEIKQTGENGKTYSFKEKNSAWEGKLTPGPYTMRVRALDRRQVPGEWSPPSGFDVNLEAVRLKFPTSNAQIQGKGDEETSMELQWEPVPGASEYRIEITSKDGKFREEKKLKETSWSLNLPVAQAFTWKAEALSEKGPKSEAEALSEFSVLGAPLTAPKIDAPENEFVREVRWSKPPHASHYEVVVSKLNREAKRWERIQVLEKYQSDSTAFNPTWSGGTYKIQVTAQGDQRAPSKPQSVQFKVRGGDRSPAAEFTHEVRKSIDRINGWYAIASYLITQINYSSKDFDGQNGVLTNYPAVGGTGRLGLGHFREEKPWGFLGIIDMSGFMSMENKPLTYMSAEASAVWRTVVGERGEFRSQMGLYYREHQVAVPELSGTSATIESYKNAAVWGPHLSGEYWHSLTPKIGIQAHTHFYYSLMKVRTPNNQALDPSLSTQFGVMGSYRFSRKLTGLMGYSRREDVLRYKSDPANSANNGQINEARVDGNYLSLFAEYSF